VYTVTISILCVFSLGLLLFKWKEYKNVRFYFWLPFSCMFGWIEFICYLRYDAWLFNPKHVIGLKIIGVTIEDYLFCVCFSIIFYWMYNKTKLLFRQRQFNPKDKLLFVLPMVAILVLYFDIGSIFSKYMSFRAGIGLLGLVYCWNKVSFRHCIFFILIVYVIGFGWDLPSVANKIWYYTDGKTISQIYTGITFNILGGIFPIELFGYYFTGALFSFGSLAFFDKYFSYSKNMELI